MPRYYCDYCDAYLTHDSPSVRKTHNAGRKHKDNVRKFYQNWMEEQAQRLVDATTEAYRAGRIAVNPFAAAVQPVPMVPPPQVPPTGFVPPIEMNPVMMPPRLPGSFDHQLPVFNMMIPPVRPVMSVFPLPPLPPMVPPVGNPVGLQKP